ncbi:NAD-binding protein [Nitrosopumilus sp.]|uniref:NAD-binding protein n=1 Tax=Nitrosopumilus sp. TaxID=2024843 RepID=UPI003B591432
MTEIILGMGEVGKTLFDLLLERKFNCVGIDADEQKCKNYSENSLKENPEYLHVCLPGELEDFVDIVSEWIKKLPNLKMVLIHSTIRPGTTKQIQEKSKIPILFSPVRGVHRRFLEDMKKYTKFISSDSPINEETKKELEERFHKIDLMSTTKTAEYAKILVDTTYYGWLINYAQITKMICQKEGIDFDEMWKFADEIHSNLGNRPKMYPGIIGGHCVIPNLSLLENEDLKMIKKVNELYEKFKKQ